MAKTVTSELQSFVRRTKRLSRGVTLRRFPDGGAAEILGLQIELGVLQRELQAAISAAKVEARADKSLRGAVQELRVARWHSKRLGDALAWQIFLRNEKALRALAHNGRTPDSAAESVGGQGVTATVTALMSQGWGLPIMHDVTDCLRIGDATFVSFPTGPESPALKTIEIKTSVTGVAPHPDGGDLVSYQVEVVSAEPLPGSDLPTPSKAPAVPGMVVPVSPVPYKQLRNDRRLNRQVERMSKALDRQSVEDNVLTALDGLPHISLIVEIETNRNWKELRRAIRKARANGHSFFALSSFLGYSILYNADGITEKDLELASLPDTVISALLPAELGDRNSILINQIPIKEHETDATTVLPFYLYDIPKRAIDEMLDGQLLILGFLNSGLVERALTEEGFEIEHDAAAADTRSFDVFTTLTWPTGEWARVQVPAPWDDMRAALHEFQGIDWIIAKMNAVHRIPDLVSHETFIAGQSASSSTSKPI